MTNKNENIFPALLLMMIIGMLSTSCGQMKLPVALDVKVAKGVKKYSSSDTYFHDYIHTYIEACEIYYSEPEKCDEALHIPVNFDNYLTNRCNISNNTIGCCYRWDNGPEITIHTSQIQQTFLEKLILIAHEMGHCHLGLEHDDEVMVAMSLYIKKSIMHSYAGGYDENLLPQYFKELFTKNAESLEDQFTNLISTNNYSREIAKPYFQNNSLLTINPREIAIFIGSTTHYYQPKCWKNDCDVDYRKLEDGVVVESNRFKFKKIKIDYENFTITTPHAKLITNSGGR